MRQWFLTLALPLAVGCGTDDVGGAGQGGHSATTPGCPSVAPARGSLTNCDVDVLCDESVRRGVRDAFDRARQEPGVAQGGGSFDEGCEDIHVVDALRLPGDPTPDTPLTKEDCDQLLNDPEYDGLGCSYPEIEPKPDEGSGWTAYAPRESEPLAVAMGWVEALNARDWERACALSWAVDGMPCEEVLTAAFRDFEGEVAIEGAYFGSGTDEMSFSLLDIPDGFAAGRVERQAGRLVVHWEAQLIR